LLNAESLKAIGVSTVGQRLAILKAVYQLKLAHNIPIDPDSYVPPCQFLLSP
jgi:bZIP factor